MLRSSASRAKVCGHVWALHYHNVMPRQRKHGYLLDMTLLVTHNIIHDHIYLILLNFVMVFKVLLFTVFVLLSECSNATCPGGYGLNQTSACSICPNNTYSSADSLYCLPCLYSSTSDSGSTICVKDDDESENKNSTTCPAGTYLEAESCIFCPNNTYSFEGAVECTNCPGNSSSLEGSTSPSNCTWENDDESENKNSSTCPAGTYLKTESCIFCPNNTYSFEGAVECTNCPGNSSSLEGSTSPSNCTWENDDESENKNSTTCPAGTYLEAESCLVCPNNTFSFLTDSDSCTDCPDNHTSAAGSTSPENCTTPQDCEAGYYYNERCLICPNNTYSFEGAVECTNCTGNFTSYAGSTSPDSCTQPEEEFRPCEAGYYYITAANNCRYGTF